MSIESVGEQWRRAVALGGSMSAEELAAEEERVQLLADAKWNIDIARGRHNPEGWYSATERILAVFKRLHDRQTSSLPQVEILTVKELVSV